MPYTTPRVKQDSQFVTVDFLAPGADRDSFYFEMTGSELHIRGRYIDDPLRVYFSLYNRGGGKIDATYTVPVPFVGEAKYIGAWYTDGVLRFRFRRTRGDEDENERGGSKRSVTYRVYFD